MGIIYKILKLRVYQLHQRFINSFIPFFFLNVIQFIRNRKRIPLPNRFDLLYKYVICTDVVELISSSEICMFCVVSKLDTAPIAKLNCHPINELTT